jgi:small-conductance mechanosensitive channel
MDIPFILAFINKIWLQGQEYFYQQVLSWAMAVQIAIAVVALLLALKITRAIRSWFARQQAQCPETSPVCADLPRLIGFVRIVGTLIAVIFIWTLFRTAEHFNWPRDGLYTISVVLIALFFIRLFTDEMDNRFWAKILSGAIWFWAVLYIFHIIEPWHNILKHIDFHLGHVEISLFVIARALVFLLLLYWLCRNLLIIWRFWLSTGSALAPALQVLLYKLGVIVLFSISVLLILQFMGIGMTFFTLFSGALGLGLGFGLQKVFANLVSGFIILADKSIKPGDVIQLGDKYGWINFLGSRYISVISRNGTEHLIPNENLVTGEVINWSYSNNLVRLNLPIGVAYDSDLEQARKLLLESAAATPRVLTDPEPSCYLLGFGDNSVNLELRVWINDPQNGINPVKSEILWAIWRSFREHGVVLPFPQRDLHLKTEVKVRTGPGEGPETG